MKVLKDQPMKLFKVLFQTCLIFIFTAVAFQNARASRSAEEPDQAVKIGLLIPDNKSIAAVQGAEMAIRKANENGGFEGRPFQIAVRSMEGPWGTGSKQAVDLIFEEKVWALLGSHDGRNAHLVEQVSTKAIVPFVSAWAADPTLSQAFVPWFFNCVPNDVQQAEALFEEIYIKRKINKVVTVSDNDYDSNQALNNLLKKVRLEQKADPVQFRYENYSEKINDLLDQINNSDPGCIILLCKPRISSQIYSHIRQRKMNQPVFGSLYLMNENELTGEELLQYDNALLIPSEKWSDSKNTAFIQEYRELYGKPPGMVAAYAFDGMNLLIEAIKNAGGSDRELIQKSLQEIHYEGVTGTISFDGMGIRLGTYLLSPVQNGVPVIPDK